MIGQDTLGIGLDPPTQHEVEQELARLWRAYAPRRTQGLLPRLRTETQPATFRYNPAEQRAPRGTETGGQWTVGATAAPSAVLDRPVASASLVEPEDYATPEQAAEDLHRRYPSIRFNFDGAIERNVRATARAFITEATRYPEVLPFLDEVSTDYTFWRGRVTGKVNIRNTYAVTTTIGAGRDKLTGQKYRIILNPLKYDDPALVDRLKADVESGWHPVGSDNVGSIMSHEFGHLVDLATYYSHPYGWAQLPDGQVVDWAIARRPKPRPVMRGFSRYGNTDPSEMVAEVFAAMEGSPDDYIIGRRTDGMGVSMDTFLAKFYPSRKPWRGVYTPGKGKAKA